MNNLNLEQNKEYDDIPIIYCKSCLSLRIMNYLKIKPGHSLEGVIDDFDYCDTCGSTDLDTCSIEEYLQLKKKYKK